MVHHVVEDEWSEPLLERGLYIWSVILAGLKDFEFTNAEVLLGEGGVCRSFGQEFNLTPSDWELRRTSRYIEGGKLGQNQRNELYKAAGFIASHLSFQSSVNIRWLSAEEVLSVKATLANQVFLDEQVLGIGLFHNPSKYPSVRQNWAVMGMIAQLLCVFANKVASTVFLSHGLEQSTYSESLSAVDYVLFFGG